MGINITFENLAIDENGNNLCKPIKYKQKVSIELSITDIDDIRELKEAMKKLRYEKTFSGRTPDEKYLMEFEK